MVRSKMPTPQSDDSALSPTPSPAEINATLLDLYRSCCAGLPDDQHAVLSPATTIGSPVLECVLTAARAEQGALLLAHLPEATGAWLAPSELGRAAIERVLALSHTQLDYLLAEQPPDRRWLRFATPLTTDHDVAIAVAPAFGRHPLARATHLVVALGWPSTPTPDAVMARAQALLAPLAGALCSSVNMILLQEWIGDLEAVIQVDESHARQAEAARAEWQQAFDAVSDPIGIIDAEYKVVRANAAHQALFGPKATSVERHHCYMGWGSQTVPCEGCPLPQTLLTGQPGFVRRERVTPDGAEGRVQRHIYDVWTYPARNPAGEIVHAVEIIKDVSEHERLSEMATNVDALREADRLKAELLGTVSHELRNPLAAIKGYAATLLRHERRLTRDERHEYLHAIVEGSDRLELLIGQLLEMSELATGSIAPRHESLDVAPIIREAIEHCERTLPPSVAALHEFTLSVSDAAGRMVARAPRVAADPRLLRDVVDNLLENAVKYTPAGGTVNVAVSVHPAGHIMEPALKDQRARAESTGQPPALDVPALEIAVHDSGVGIPADHLGRIFDRFHRVDTRLTREVDGLGLGLAICKQIVELHGGAIWAESEPGVGSTFHVLLPLDEQSATLDQPVVSAETEDH
jgi:signal transduction histidine kinase